MAEQEQNEITVIQTFLPEPLTEAEIDALIQTAIAQTGATSQKDMSKLMPILKPQLQGRADLAKVSQRIKTFLA